MSLSSKKHKTKHLWQLFHNAGEVAESNPEAVSMYAEKPQPRLTAKVRDHLRCLGWKVEFSTKDGVTKYRYTMPGKSGRTYYSLQKICVVLRSLVLNRRNKEPLSMVSDDDDNDFVCVGEKKNKQNSVSSKEDGELCIVKGECNPEAVVDWFTYKPSNLEGGARARAQDMIMKAKKHLSYMGWRFWFIDNNGRKELRYTSPKGFYYNSLRVACKAYIDECGGVEKCVGGSAIKSNNGVGSHSILKKRKHKEVAFCTGGVVSETELSTKKTKRNNVIGDQSNGDQKRTGKTLKDMIRLRDVKESKKRSGVDQLMKSLEKQAENKYGNVMKPENDEDCSVCRYGGELVLCDGCPSAFHPKCLGVNDLPEGDWFCKSCCCQICGRYGRKENDGCVLISCSQCDLNYHPKCLERQKKLKRYYPERGWFCCDDCEVVSLRLRMLRGRPIKVNESNLKWSLLKYSDEVDGEESTETNNKLKAAIEVMHECFEPSIDPRTGRDLVDDVILRKGSDLKRLNFKNFNTIILEKDDEVITVATLRVHGQRVAELPLVATKSNYRRKGMCRVMMNELEKQLGVLGVERLILPAALPVLDTWINRFGFSKVTESEKLRFLNHTFLDFQDAIMCQKSLYKRKRTEDRRILEESSPQSEVMQAENHSR